jgi:ribosomal protein L29
MVKENKIKNKIETKVTDAVKKEKKTESVKLSVEDEKINELRVELLKSGSKRQRIKREIARILTLQNAKLKEAKKLLQTPKQSKIAKVKGENK